MGNGRSSASRGGQNSAGNSPAVTGATGQNVPNGALGGSEGESEGASASYIVFNAGDSLFVSDCGTVDKVSEAESGASHWCTRSTLSREAH